MYENGKIYQSRDQRNLLKIVHEERSPMDRMPFGVEIVAGPNDFITGWYRRNGQWSDTESGHDMITEWTRPVSEFTPSSNPDSSRSILRAIPQEALQMHRMANLQMSDMINRMNSSSIFGQRPEPEAPAAPPETAVTWEDIIGLEDAKTAMQEAIEAPYIHAEVYKHFNIKPPKGVLLYGPPGCGKTMLGKAAAASMAKVHNKPYREGFFYFNGAEMIGPGFSSEVDWMKNAFEKADEFYARNKYPAILFFDECDSMLPDRSRTNFFVKNAVNIFLSKMDGMDAATAFVILATNNHHELDEAATRAGRIDRKIYVGRPNKEAASAIVKSVLGKKPLKSAVTLDEMAAKACGDLYSESKVVGDKELFQYLNGAMIVGMVEIAASLAFRKAIKANTGSDFDVSKCGIGMEEIEAAVSEVHREQVNLLKNKPLGPSDMIEAGIKAMKKVSESHEDDFNPDAP